MPPYETRRVAGVHGVELAADVWMPSPGGPPAGNGFVLIHGLASNARLYDGVADLLVEAGRSVATVDLHGHGRSDKPDGSYDFDSMCGDVAAVLRSLVLDPGSDFFSRPFVVGQSFGGNLVLELAARVPEQIAGVACIDGGTIDLRSGYSSWDEAEAALAPPPIIGTKYDDIAPRMRQMHPDWPDAGILGSLANFEVRADGTVAPWLTLDRHMKILRMLWDHPPSALYGELRVPVLLLPAESPGAAAGWATAKREAVTRALEAIDGSEVHWFSPADHDVHAQHPDQVAAVLLEWAGHLGGESPALR